MSELFQGLAIIVYGINEQGHETISAAHQNINNAEEFVFKESLPRSYSDLKKTRGVGGGGGVHARYGVL